MHQKKEKIMITRRRRRRCSNGSSVGDSANRSSSCSSSRVCLDNQSPTTTLLTRIVVVLSMLVVAASSSPVATAPAFARGGGGGASTDMDRPQKRGLQAAKNTAGITSPLELYVPAGLQSGPDGASSFAASAVYDPSRNELIVTGSTYGTFFDGDSNNKNGGDVDRDDTAPNCFLATVQLPANRAGMTATTSSQAATGSITWKHRRELRTAGISEACTDLYLYRGDRLWIAGHTEQGGVLEDLRNGASVLETVQYGMILDIPADDAAFAASPAPYGVPVTGGMLQQYAARIRPVAVTSSQGDSYLYLVSMMTDDVAAAAASTTRNEQTSLTEQDSSSDPQLLPSEAFNGKSYGMTVERIQILEEDESSFVYEDGSPLQETLQANWQRPYHTAERESVLVSGIAKVADDLLVVVGSTAGTGDAFGVEPTMGQDMDGFVTLLHASSGELLQAPHHPSQHPSIRIESLNGADDWIWGVCHHPADPDHFYIAGTTAGRMDDAAAVAGSLDDDASRQAYLMKIDVTYLRPVWTVQLGANNEAAANDDGVTVEGTACAVTRDGEVVYMAGTVSAGAVLALSGTTESYGGTDVYVVKVDARTGKQEYVRQLGSPADDAVAARGGLTTDLAGNAILVVNTKGSMYRLRSGDEDEEEEAAAAVTDVAVFTVSRFNGAAADTATHSEYKNGSGRPFPPHPSQPMQHEEQVSSPYSPSATNNNKNKWRTVLAVMVVLVGGAVLLLLFINRKLLVPSPEVQTDRSKVLAYLSEFDVEEIDLKHSATGGWHCSYAGNLARGVNRGPHGTGTDMTNTTLLQNDSIDATASGQLSSSLVDPLMPAAPPLENPSDSQHTNELIENSLFMDDDDEDNDCGVGQGLLHRDEMKMPDSSDYGGLVDAYNKSWEDRSCNSSTANSNSSKAGGSGNVWGKDIV